MDFRDYTVEDFALNKRFRKWILDPKKEDNLFWDEYLKAHPEQLNLIVEAKKLVLNLPDFDDKLTLQEKDVLWQSIDADILPEERKNSKLEKVYPIHSDSIIGKAALNKDRYTKNFYIKRALIAASILIFLTISWSIYQVIFEDAETPSTADEIIHKQNPWGQKSTVFLSDGTEIILNSGSSISYQKEFTGKTRVVHLEGEAFFKVAKNPDKPFIVVSENISTTALGTSFNVRSFPGETNEVVSLVSGKVKVVKNIADLQTEEVFLEPGEQANYSQNSKEISKGTFSPHEVTAWKEGVICFRDANATQVFGYLEKWYGVTIREVNQPVKKWNYTGEFDNMDLHNVLSSIGFTMNFEFEKEDKLITIKYTDK